MTYYLRSTGTQANLLRFPLQSANEPADPTLPDPRDKRPVEIERVEDEDQAQPNPDDRTGQDSPQNPPPAQKNQSLLN